MDVTEIMDVAEIVDAAASIDVMQTIVLVVGGLGLFLFGMKIMSSGLQTIAGDRLHSILQRATSNRVLAVLAGILVTVGLNSSTASTVMTVGFVNSGMMNLSQAIGIILGANVGTTFSGQLVAFRVDAYAPVFIFVGVILHLFFKKKSVRNIGYVILGFGVLFFGITTMGGPLRELGRLPAFEEFLVNFSNPIFALLAGFLFTAVVQSSTATTGILIAMYGSGVPIPFQTGAFIILGTNIGTSLTTMIASIPANRDSKRAALFHITFDVIGSVVFGTLIFVFPAILSWFQNTWDEPARQIAMFHTLYNFATMFLILPFTPYVAKLMEKVIPVEVTDDTDKTYEKKLMYLDSKFMPAPAVAMAYAHRELCRIHRIANETLATTLKAFYAKNAEKAGKVIKNTKTINWLSRKASAKLVKMNTLSLSVEDNKRLGKMFRVLYDMERIGDHAENIAEYTILVSENDMEFSEAAVQELKELSAMVKEMTDLSLHAFENQDTSIMPQIEALEEQVNELTDKFTESHIERLTAEKCEPRSGVVFTDMIIDLERTADHANDIAASVLPGNKMNRKKKKGKKTKV